MLAVDNNSKNAIFKFGKGIKYYALAKLFWWVFMLLILVVLRRFLDNYIAMSEHQQEENFGSLFIITSLAGIMIIGGGISLIVTYIYYFIKLVQTSTSSIGTMLRKTLLFEIIVLATIIIRLFLINPEALIVRLISIPLSIGATFYLGRWGFSLSEYTTGEKYCEHIIISIRIMQIGLLVKFGEFLCFFASPSIDIAGVMFSYAGDIIFAVGMWKTSKEIMNQFSHTEFIQTSTAFWQSSTVLGRSSTVLGQEVTLMNTPPVKLVEYPDACPLCGAPLVDPTTKFCANCGNKIK